MLAKIDAEIAWANAEKLNVTLAYPSAWGVSNPAQGVISPGFRDIRLGYDKNFSFEFTPDTNFSLDSWVAFYSSSITVEALGGNWLEDISLLPVGSISNTEAVLPVNINPNGGTFSFKVNTTKPVTLIPWCVPSPRVIRTEPRSNAPGQIISRASDIVIYFTIPLDPSNSNIKFADSASGDGIWITANGNCINNLYKTPVYSSENGFYTISILPSNNLPPADSEITVTVRGIKNSNGMHESGVHEFGWIASNTAATVDTWEAEYEKDDTGAWVINYSWTSVGADNIKTYYRINNGSKILNSDGANTSAVIKNVPLLNASGVRSGTSANVTEYEIIIELYKDNNKSGVKSFKILNVPGMVNNSVNPLIEINNSEQFTINNEQLNKNFLLTNDITLTNYVPIGTSTTPFTGKFYGNGHTITITGMTNAADMGLFGAVSSGTVRDLTVNYNNVNINPEIKDLGYRVNLNLPGTSHNWVDVWGSIFGGIAGTVSGGTRFENVLVNGAVNIGKNEDNAVHAGGIVGQITSTETDPRVTITNSYCGLNLTVNRIGFIGGVAGTIGIGGDLNSGSAALLEKITVVGNITIGSISNWVFGDLRAGGFVGFARGAGTGTLLAVFDDVKYKDGIITVNKRRGHTRVGGAIGHINGNVDIQNCSSIADSLNIDKEADGTLNPNTYFVVGGFIGEVEGNNVMIENCYSDNPVNISYMGNAFVQAGGFAGRSFANITYSYAKGDMDITVQNAIYTGGFAGQTSGGKISFCYATGNVRVLSTGAYGALGAGGFVGVGSETQILHSYARGNVYARENGALLSAGGFAGRNYSSVFENCFALGNVIGHNTTQAALVGGHTGWLADSSATVKNCVVAVLPDNLNAGMSITATGGHIGNVVGRVYGSTVDGAIRSNNYAWNGIKLLTHTTTGATSGFTTVTPVNNANGKDGANLTSEMQYTRSFWRDTMEFNPDHWIFGSVDTRGYPILRGPDVGFEPGPAMGGQ